MFGRSSDDVAPALPVDEHEVGGGRAAAISILPGVPLPRDLVQTPIPAAPVEPHVAAATDADREHELVSVGAPTAEGGFGVGTLTPPAPAPSAKVKAKRSSFSGLRRRKDEPEAPAGEDQFAAAPIEPATGFFGNTDPVTGQPTGPVGEAHVVTEVHVVAEAPEPFDIAAELAAEAVAAPAPASAPAPTPPPFVPSAATPVAAPELPAPPPFVPSAAVPAVAPALPVDEDPLFHHVPVLTDAPAPVTPTAGPAAAPATKPSFADRLRGLRPSAPVAPVPAAPAVAPPPYAPAPADAVSPPPFVPAAPAAPAPPAYVPLGTPAPPAGPPVGPPLEAADLPAPTSSNVPAFAHLVPTQPVGFPAEMGAMAEQVAAQVATERADYAAASTVGLVFADGSHAELGDGPDGEALQHVARVLSDPSLPRAEGAEGTAPIE